MSEESDDSIVLSDSYFDNSLVRNVKDIYLANQLFDITLLTSQGIIKAHKLMLAASSEYFRVLFTTELRSHKSKVDLSFVDEDALKLIIGYFYSGKIKLRIGILGGVMEVAEFLCVGSLRPLIVEAVNHFLFPDSISSLDLWSIWLYSKAFNYSEASLSASFTIKSNFSTLISYDSFMEVPFDSLDACLSSSFLDVPKEDELLKRLCSWLTYDIDSRKGHINSLLGKIDASRLESASQSLTWVQERFTSYGVSHLTEHWIKKWNEASEEIPKEENRYFEKIVKAVMVIGGRDGEKVLETVECFDQGRWWSTLPSSKSRKRGPVVTSLLVPRYAAASTSSPVLGTIYILGGASSFENVSDLGTHCEIYSALENKWRLLPLLPSGRMYAAAAHVDDTLYISGGLENNHPSNSLWALIGDSKSWKELRSMIHPRWEHCLVSLYGVLFAIGGFDNLSKAMRSVERYEPWSNTWTEVRPMKQARARAGAVVDGCYIYVLGGTAHLRETNEFDPCRDTYYERFNGKEGLWEDCGVCPNSSWSRVRSAHIGKGLILSTVGTVGSVIYRTSLSSIEEEGSRKPLKEDDPPTTFPGPPLTRPRVDHSLASVFVPIHSPPPL